MSPRSNLAISTFSQLVFFCLTTFPVNKHGPLDIKVALLTALEGITHLCLLRWDVRAFQRKERLLGFHLLYRDSPDVEKN